MAGLLFLLFLLHAGSKSAGRTVKGRSGRTYVVLTGPTGAAFVTSIVTVDGKNGLISFRQYTAPTGQFKVGNRELVSRAPVSPSSAAGIAARAAVRDFGPFQADNGLTDEEDFA